MKMEILFSKSLCQIGLCLGCNLDVETLQQLIYKLFNV
jgi:hypothetical protein